MRYASLRLAALLIAAASVIGCGSVSKVVIVPVGEPVILLEDTPTNSNVFVKSEGKWVQGEVDYIPAGWACLAVEKDDFR